MTVGTVTANRKADRPPVGSSCSCVESMTAPVEALDVSMRGACPVTVTVSWSVPTSSVMSSVTNCCAPIRTPRLSYALNPVNVALTVAETAYFMEKGEIRFHGPTQELLSRPDILRSVFLEGAAR